MERAEAIENGRCYRIFEMLDLLAQETTLPRELCEAVLGAWIGVVRSSVLSTAEQDGRYFEHLEQGRAVLILRNLIPPIWVPNHLLLAQDLSRQTGVSWYQTSQILSALSLRLGELAGEKAFEPLGWIEDTGPGWHLAIHLWSDFLQPKIDAPIEVITG